MKPTKNDFTTLKVSKANINRLFKLKSKPSDTYNDVICRMLDLIEKSYVEKVTG